jgi:6-phosphofructokinase
VENLQWVTHRENIHHCINQGRAVYKKGDECKQAVLSEKVVRKIKSEIGSMTHRDLAKKYNTNYSNIAHIKRGSRWGHVRV